MQQSNIPTARDKDLITSAGDANGPNVMTGYGDGALNSIVDSFLRSIYEWKHISKQSKRCNLELLQYSAYYINPKFQTMSYSISRSKKGIAPHTVGSYQQEHPMTPQLGEQREPRDGTDTMTSFQDHNPKHQYSMQTPATNEIGG